jgi:hypothetical protein
LVASRLIDEIKQDLAVWDISHSTDGAEMDDAPSPDEDEGNEIRVAQFGAKSLRDRKGSNVWCS